MNDAAIVTSLMRAESRFFFKNNNFFVWSVASVVLPRGTIVPGGCAYKSVIEALMGLAQIFVAVGLEGTT